MKEDNLIYMANIEECLKEYQTRTGHTPGLIEINSVDYERLLKETLHKSPIPIKVLSIGGVNIIPDDDIAEGNIRLIND